MGSGLISRLRFKDFLVFLLFFLAIHLAQSLGFRFLHSSLQSEFERLFLKFNKKKIFQSWLFEIEWSCAILITCRDVIHGAQPISELNFIKMLTSQPEWTNSVERKVTPCSYLFLVSSFLIFFLFILLSFPDLKVFKFEVPGEASIGLSQISFLQSNNKFIKNMPFTPNTKNV